jgi:ketosteroid isomerase-like protein
MNIKARAPLLFLAAGFAALFLGGCTPPVKPETQIRARLASIREAILAKRVDGIFEFGTPDWTFVGPDGKSFSRTAYRERTTKLFAEIGIESLETNIERVDVRRGQAEVRLTQTMVRTERDATGATTRWRVTYQETQEWVETPARGWLVVRVQVYNPKRVAWPAA